MTDSDVQQRIVTCLGVILDSLEEMCDNDIPASTSVCVDQMLALIERVTDDNKFMMTVASWIAGTLRISAITSQTDLGGFCDDPENVHGFMKRWKRAQKSVHFPCPVYKSA